LFWRHAAPPCVQGGYTKFQSDKTAGDVLERPVSPKDVLATVYYLLGIAPETTLTNRFGQPVPLVSEGKVVQELLG
jgi:hypothetical protein